MGNCLGASTCKRPDGEIPATGAETSRREVAGKATALPSGANRSHRPQESVSTTALWETLAGVRLYGCRLFIQWLLFAGTLRVPVEPNGLPSPLHGIEPHHFSPDLGQRAGIEPTFPYMTRKGQAIFATCFTSA